MEGGSLPLLPLLPGDLLQLAGLLAAAAAAVPLGLRLHLELLLAVAALVGRDEAPQPRRQGGAGGPLARAALIGRALRHGGRGLVVHGDFVVHVERVVLGEGGTFISPCLPKRFLDKQVSHEWCWYTSVLA